MQNYTYQNAIISKKELRQLLAWSFTNYDSMQACYLADELKYLGFKYATQAGISISIEDLKVPFIKNLILTKANQEIINVEKIYLKGKITDVEKFQKIIDTWSSTSESLKTQIIYYFKNYDPLNSVYIMAFSGARGNLSQVRQLVGMRGLMSDPSGEIMNLPIKKNFREGLTITDYLMSGYGARKGIIDTALKTANSGYLTRRLIDVAQDILIREKNCLTKHSFFFQSFNLDKNELSSKLLGRILNKSIYNNRTNKVIAKLNTQITPLLIEKFQHENIKRLYIRSPLTCSLYRAVCQNCYGWDLSHENLVDIGEAIGILAGQSIGEPGTQLTMRTFHTGGIFTSEARQQIISPLNGIIQFYKNLKTVIIRTNRGEEVLVTKNSGSLILIPDDKTQQLIQIDITRNTILFPKNNQYVLKNSVIGELINTNKQTRSEIKPIITYQAGEVFIPTLKKKISSVNNNKLLWILSGDLYKSPKSSFLNFYPDYKLNFNSYIFRTKIQNHYGGLVRSINTETSLPQKIIEIVNNKFVLKKSKFQKLKSPLNLENYILNIKKLKYFVQIKKAKFAFHLKLTNKERAGTLITNSFRTLTGGHLFYHGNYFKNFNKETQTLVYFPKKIHQKKISALVFYKTLIWLEEEIHKVNCEQNILLVEHGDVISTGFELIPGLFTKTSGLVNIFQTNSIVKTISIKSGLVYQGKNFKSFAKKFYYPGEIIFSKIITKTLSFCEQIVSQKKSQLLIRPIKLYEFPYLIPFSSNADIENITKQEFALTSESLCLYKPNQMIKSAQSLNLIISSLIFKTNKLISHNLKLELKNSIQENSVTFQLIEKLHLQNYLSPYLRYQNIQSCFLLQRNQFLSPYVTIGYLESVIKNSSEIVKIKIKNKKSKQIFLILNKHCLKISKRNLRNQQFTIDNLITKTSNINQAGKVIIDNENFLTIQKGIPYFFPNCKKEDQISKTNLQYKFISSNYIRSRFSTNRKIFLNYQNLLKFSTNKSFGIKPERKFKLSIKAEFSKIFMKNNGKLYTSLIPQFFKKLSLNNSTQKFNLNALTQLPRKSKNLINEQTLLIKNWDTRKNLYKSKSETTFQLMLLKFVEQPFTKVSKVTGLYAITEDLFDQDVNNVFCKNNEFIESGKTLGLLNLEKEVTGDIVQGLPQIEEILEVRKKNSMAKRIPKSQKKGLLIQKTSLDPNFDFRKLGTPIKENDKINSHKLLKVYFNYYGSLKIFCCESKKHMYFASLIKNYEGSYKSFKKVQTFILNAIQSIYKSQGVTINDKHLEVIIKQMTTKVLITYEGDTPLLRREIIDLYHIKYINETIRHENKQESYYVPLLLGISKAALNNPSFISAASFQETTKVLTKAAIEGRIDWLRGLKENIIIGHLIPSGTGSQTYRNSFRKDYLKTNYKNLEVDAKKNIDNILNIC